MRHQIYAPVFLLIWILMPAMLYGQTLDTDTPERQFALQQLEGVLTYADKIDGMPSIKVKAKADAVLWNQSPDRARALFLSLWEFIERQKDDKSFDQEEARLVVLRNLYPNDQKLANHLLQRLEEKTQADSDQSSFDRIRGTNQETQRLAKLALQLVDVDPMLAAKVLQQSLTQNTSPGLIFVLSRFRESDPLFADQLATNVLQNLNNQPKPVAVTGLSYLIAYLFPDTPMPPVSEQVKQADKRLQTEFVSVGYQILKASLAEPDSVTGQALSGKHLQFKTFSQAFVAASLAAMATSFAPNVVNELDQITEKLLRGLPPPLVQIVGFQSAVIRRTATRTNTSEDSNDEEIFAAIAKGQFDNAQALIDQLKDESKKKAYGQRLLKAQFKAYLIRADLNAATKTARKVEDSASRIQLFAEITRVAFQRGEWTASADVLTEARKTTPSPDRAGPHARALFSLAAEAASFSAPDALIVLQDTVKQVNALARRDKDGTGDKPQVRGSSTLNDSDRFIDSSEMMRAFGAVGRDYFDNALVVAAGVDNKAVQAMARLAIIENRLKATPPTRKPKPSVNSSKPE
jgi:hypothetical protein